MKRFLIFVSAHLFLFLLVIAYQAKADDEEWNINRSVAENVTVDEPVAPQSSLKVTKLLDQV